MKITNSSDWRDALPFETPVLASEAVPGEPTRCAGCGADAVALPRTELWALKHRHPNNPAGFVRFYCLDHRPAVKSAPVAPVRAARAPSGRARAERAERRPAAPKVPERVAALCPECFVEVPPSGVCGMCGTRVG
ncbi:glucose-6-phosphate dehydrogenase [Microbacterium sp. W1N]|uniref:glucose-6-phosphate dehydrogenase n=1 Tax=Microbacterium festucae TaxID=2977531 RepID=UPI0021BF115C|nr:glucose-6-phosphate dehydrogenase [Microbacterium festucae]MCT9820754.1 glucose-6-phosphate dehydrogenase [Microbacterium festucae]